MTWTWPKTIESSNINEDTEVPVVDGTYNFVTYCDPGYGEDSIFFGTDDHDGQNPQHQVVSQPAKLATGFVWKSFVSNLQLLLGQVTDGIHKQNDQQMPTHDPILPTIRRLDTLRSLSLGESVHSSRCVLQLCAICLHCSQLTLSPNLKYLSFQLFSIFRIIPTLSPNIQAYATAVNSLDDLIREWQLLYQSLEDNASHPLKDAKPDSVQRRPIEYSFEDAVHSWSRVVPRFD